MVFFDCTKKDTRVRNCKFTSRPIQNDGAKLTLAWGAKAAAEPTRAKARANFMVGYIRGGVVLIDNKDYACHGSGANCSEDRCVCIDHRSSVLRERWWIFWNWRTRTYLVNWVIIHWLWWCRLDVWVVTSSPRIWIERLNWSIPFADDTESYPALWGRRQMMWRWSENGRLKGGIYPLFDPGTDAFLKLQVNTPNKSEHAW